MLTTFVRLLPALLLATSSLVGEPTAMQMEMLTRGTSAGWLSAGMSNFNLTLTQNDIKLLNQTGVRHVRLYIKSSSFITGDLSTGTLSPECLAALNSVLKLLKNEGLAAIVVPFHGMKDGTPALGSPEAANMVKIWGALAKNLSATDPNQVFLEVYDQPNYLRASDWNELQSQLIPAIREGAPQHLIIAPSNMRSNGSWLTGDPKTITRMKLSTDPNVIYSFHYISPTLLTLQGQAFENFKNNLKNLPYPSSPEIIAPMLAAEMDPVTKNHLEAYGKERWNRAHIRQDLAPVADWATKNKVVVICDSFGAFRPNADPESRENYLRDVREALEDFHIPWSVKSEGFGILDRKKAATVLDEVAARALGLKAK